MSDADLGEIKEDIERIVHICTLEELAILWERAPNEEKGYYKKAMKLKLLAEITEALLD